MKKYLAVLAIGILGSAAGLYYVGFVQDPVDDQEQIADMQIYETEVDSATDCASFEKYDATRKVCSFECASDAECQDLQQKVDAEFSQWTVELKNDKTPVAEKKIEDGQGREASYFVAAGEKITLKSGIDLKGYRDIWNDIKSLSPDDLTDKYIETYEVYNNPDDDTLAFVDDDDGNGRWRISINMAGYKTSTQRENKATIIHELGHIISLNDSQVNPNTATCPNLKLDEGCANKDSAINVFWNRYWKGIVNPEYDENSYVDEYATTNETEDFAETFAFFVLGKDTDLGNSIKDQKIKMMYSFPDLVAIRTEMRGNLSKDVIRARGR